MSTDMNENAMLEGELSADEILQRAVMFALDEAAEQLEQSDGVEPFLVMLKGEEMFVEEISAETEAESFALARKSIYQMEKLCTAYVFCYDGFVELDSGTSDALIAEFAEKDDAEAQIIVCLYKRDSDELEIEDELYHVGETLTLFGAAPADGADGDGDAAQDASDGEAVQEATESVPSQDAQAEGAQGAPEGEPAEGAQD